MSGYLHTCLKDFVECIQEIPDIKKLTFNTSTLSYFHYDNDSRKLVPIGSTINPNALYIEMLLIIAHLEKRNYFVDCEHSRCALDRILAAVNHVCSL